MKLIRFLFSTSFQNKYFVYVMCYLEFQEILLALYQNFLKFGVPLQLI